jgi:sulfatase modifying factor 1
MSRETPPVEVAGLRGAAGPVPAAEPVAPCCAPGRTGGAPVGGRTRPGGRRSAPDGSPDLVEIPAGCFTMGTDRGDGDPADGEGPAHVVHLAAYRIAPTAVTNADFARFVAATGHRTVAEGIGDSFVFAGHLPDDHPPTRAVAATPWWRLVEGADWRHPEGPASSIEGRERHPVVHVAWTDARAYCAWSGTRLPTEAEWERAARGGLDGVRFPWGDEREPGGEPRMNVFRGRFPRPDDPERCGTCPVDAYAPNGLGLHNTTGNVWELCADRFDPRYYRASPATDPRGPHRGAHRVMRGGSYLCHESYCNRYRVDARSATTPDSATGNVGFRVAADAPAG